MSASNRRPLAFVLFAAGLVLFIIAIVYFTTPADSLPGFLGQLEGNDVIRWKRGTAALVLSVLADAAGLFMLRRSA